jgi:hypothetical protein
MAARWSRYAHGAVLPFADATPDPKPIRNAQTAVIAALTRKQIAENVISMRFSVATQGRAIRRAAPRRYR